MLVSIWDILYTEGPAAKHTVTMNKSGVRYIQLVQEFLE